MKIKELHEDIERYLAEDCYCPNEVYSLDGFFYHNYYSEQDCKLLGKRDELIAYLAHPFNDEKERQTVVLFFIENGKCYDSTWYDATENNLKITEDILENGVNGRRFSFDNYK